jgi:hypothetical protein
MRNYIRYHTGMPVEYSFSEDEPGTRKDLKDICTGGLCFYSGRALRPGTQIHLLIPISGDPFEGEGFVVWCRKEGEQYGIGVQFYDATIAYSANMVNQLSHIEDYRHRLQVKEGRALSSEEAATEWFQKYVA